MGNVAKGFTLRVATQTSPRVGEILASGLYPALRCVQLWPRDPLTRQRVVAYFQRLVTTVGPAVFPTRRRCWSTCDAVRRPPPNSASASC